MKGLKWFRPKAHMKIWLLLGFFGQFFLAAILSYFLIQFYFELKWEMKLTLGLSILMIIYYSFSCIYRYLLNDTSDNKGKFDRWQKNNRTLVKGPKVVVIGGGTGLSILLRGLKRYTANISAIVTVADDGGGSGKLREDLGMLPPGDIRSCILALAEMEPTMEKLFQYRFEEGSLKGQSFGNLFIASMNGISSNFEEAIKKISEVLAVTGNVYPVSMEDITLFARLKNGIVVKGESKIPLKSTEEESPVDWVFIKPREAKGLSEAVEAIQNADVIVLGPGSLYTSIIPNLLIRNIKNSLITSKAAKIYISNIMTQPGETDNYSVLEHVEAILKHCGSLKINYVLANDGEIDDAVQSKYKMEGAALVKITESDRDKLKSKKIHLIEENFIEIKKDYVRHDAIKLSKLITELASNKSLLFGKIVKSRK
jgi:uncharacterized cofD-like protein